MLVSFVFSGSCVNSNVSEVSKNSNNNVLSNKTIGNSKEVKGEVDELLEIIRLPELPEEVVWKEESLGKSDNSTPASTDKKLIAVLRYKPEVAAKVVALVEKNKTPEQVEVSAENWFPEELIAQAQLSGNESLKGKAYGANDFFNIPYGSGRITRIEGTDYFILELSAT